MRGVCLWYDFDLECEAIKEQQQLQQLISLDINFLLCCSPVFLHAADFTRETLPSADNRTNFTCLPSESS